MVAARKPASGHAGVPMTSEAVSVATPTPAARDRKFIGVPSNSTSSGAGGCGYGALDWHSLRHVAGSLMAERGLSAQDIAYQLGHTDGGRLAQRLYIHTYEESARERIKRAFGENVAPLRAVSDTNETHTAEGSA